MNQRNYELFEAELETVARTPQEREEAEKKANMLAMLEKIRIKPDINCRRWNSCLTCSVNRVSRGESW